MRSTAFFYGHEVPVATLAHFERIVVQPDHVDNLAALRASGADVFAYLSVGEAEGWRASTQSLPTTLFIGSNPAWRNRVADLTDPGWHHYLIEQRMAPLWALGYRGFFLDTLDSYQLAVSDAPSRSSQKQALVALIRAMHGRFPGVKLLFNRGFDLLPDVGHLAAGVVAESLYRSWNPSSATYVTVSEDDRRWLIARLDLARRKYGLPVTVIDYVPAAETALAIETAGRIRGLGYFPWVATPALDVLPAGAPQ